MTAMPIGPSGRVQLEVHHAGPTLAQQALAGLTRLPRSLPSAGLYDPLGWLLFDQLRSTAAYAPTHTEHALLVEHGLDIIRATRPNAIVELGSGNAARTRLLLDALGKVTHHGTYIPVDVSEDVLRGTLADLAQEYPWLRLRGTVADYEHDASRIPSADRQLVLLMGGKLGTFTPSGSRSLLRTIAERLSPVDHLLLGLDLMRPETVLHHAYNDAAGLTARFNKNALSALNRGLGADFRPEQFRHVAQVDALAHHTTLYLVSRVRQTVTLPRPGLRVALSESELLCTGTLRTFTRASATDLLHDAGLELVEWYCTPNDCFAVVLCAPRGPAARRWR
jgi:L-histidine N-alpha-methyltransferase